MCKVYTEYQGTSEIGHGLCFCKVDNPLTKAQGFSLHTGTQTMLYLSHKSWTERFNWKIFALFVAECLFDVSKNLFLSSSDQVIIKVGQKLVS